MTASATISLSVSASVAGSPDLGSAIHKFSELFENSLLNGTGADQINQAFADIRTLSASSSEELDLAGSLVNALGATITFTTIKGIIVMADADNGGNIEVGGASSNGFSSPFGDATDVVLIPPGGFFCLTAPDSNGFAVTASTGDLLQVANAYSGAAATYTIILLGVE